VKEQSQGLIIVKKAEKTDSEFSVFLNEISKKILEKYDYNLNRMSNPAFNRILKEFLKSTELFNDETKFKEGKRRLQRWEIISIHRGRDTFITMLIEENVPLNIIMKYTGHKKLSTLEKYIDKNKKIDNFMDTIFK
jgi:integrase